MHTQTWSLLQGGSPGTPQLSTAAGPLGLRAEFSTPDLLLGAALPTLALLTGLCPLPTHTFLPQDETLKPTKFIFHSSTHLFNKYLPNVSCAHSPSLLPVTCLAVPTAFLCSLLLSESALRKEADKSVHPDSS